MPGPDAEASPEVAAARLLRELVRADLDIKKQLTDFGPNATTERRVVEEQRSIQQLLGAQRARATLLEAAARKGGGSLEVVGRYRQELERDERQLMQSVEELAEQTARQQLFSASDVEQQGSTGPSFDAAGLRRRRNEQRAAQHAHDVARQTTATLGRLVGNATTQLRRAEDTTLTLAHSSELLAKTQSEYDTHSAHIRTGQQLLSKYERRELTDKILIALALILYLAVCYYILRKRVLLRFWIF